jgi:hypothetical protein
MAVSEEIAERVDHAIGERLVLRRSGIVTQSAA